MKNATRAIGVCDCGSCAGIQNFFHLIQTLGQILVLLADYISKISIPEIVPG
jgi:predicted metal-binding protein